MPRRERSERAADAAARVRQWLGVAHQEQSAWSSDREALNAWKAVLEDAGIFVFSHEMGSGEVLGFSSWDEVAPMVVLNSNDATPAARCFTLAHELGHLTSRQDSACESADLDKGTRSQVERWCNEFAAAFLMPADRVQKVLEEVEVPPNPAGLSEVALLTRVFRVSGRAAARRLVELNLASDRLYGEVEKVYVTKPPKKQETVKRPPRSVTRVREYGLKAITTVIESVDEGDALFLLRMTAQDTRDLASREPIVRAV